MLQGMTGFGSASKTFGRAKVTVEIKSLNHKFFEVISHMPEGFLGTEETLKKILAAKIRRGRVSLVLNTSGFAQEEAVLNKDIARRYFLLLRELKEQLKMKDSVCLANIIHLPGVFALEKMPQANHRLSGLLESLLKQALADLLKMRKEEGRVIARDLGRRIKDIQNICQAIQKKAAQAQGAKQKTASCEEFETYRKATDITEELLRLKLHLKSFLSATRKDEAVGKELDFISQELQRETNTIGAKSQDGVISGLVIKIKTQVEKIREQLQNVE